MAQPPLSRQIRELEGELATRLFNRTTRGVELTDAGRVLLEEARAALTQVDHAAEAARRAGQGEIGQLVVGVVPTVDTLGLHAHFAHVLGALSERPDRHSEPQHHDADAGPACGHAPGRVPALARPRRHAHDQAGVARAARRSGPGRTSARACGPVVARDAGRRAACDLSASGRTRILRYDREPVPRGQGPSPHRAGSRARADDPRAGGGRLRRVGAAWYGSEPASSGRCLPAAHRPLPRAETAVAYRKDDPSEVLRAFVVVVDRASARLPR